MRVARQAIRRAQKTQDPEDQADEALIVIIAAAALVETFFIAQAFEVAGEDEALVQRLRADLAAQRSFETLLARWRGWLFQSAHHPGFDLGALHHLRARRNGALHAGRVLANDTPSVIDVAPLTIEEASQALATAEKFCGDVLAARGLAPDQARAVLTYWLGAPSLR